MCSNAIKLKAVTAGMLLTVVSPAMAQDKQPEKKGPAPELHGGFTFTSTQKDGKMEWKVDGTSATFIGPNLIDLREVQAVHFSDDGTSTVATTEKALLDKEKRYLSTDDFITIVTQNSVITGTGFEWDHNKRTGCVKNNVKVVYEHPEGGGVIK